METILENHAKRIRALEERTGIREPREWIIHVSKGCGKPSGFYYGEYELGDKNWCETVKVREVLP